MSNHETAPMQSRAKANQGWHAEKIKLIDPSIGWEDLAPE
jgi:hypothetical protein